MDLNQTANGKIVSILCPAGSCCVLKSAEEGVSVLKAALHPKVMEL